MASNNPQSLHKPLSRRKILSFMAGVGAISASGVALRAAFTPQHVGVTKLRVGLPGLPNASDGLRVAFLTDLHYGPDTPIETIINAIALAQKEAPDLILLGGDYIQWSMDHLSGVIPILATLRAPLGVFGVLGNHDYHNPDLLTERIGHESGIRILRNNGLDLHNGLFVCGIEDTWRGRFNATTAEENRPKGTGMIALSHNPVGINLFRNADAFVLSGHTHGGQVLLPGILPHRAPGLGDFPVLQGWYGIQGTSGFVSRGVGQTMLPIRINCPPEIVIATLVGLPAGDRCQTV